MSERETAIVAGGCFWCTEAVFRDVIGVCEVESGYIGGTMPNPDYRSVCSGVTGHAEAVRVEFDPAVISYGEILDIFMATHDPTQLNRQGNDIGTQYRSAIFPLNDAQRAEAEAAIDQAIAADPGFWDARRLRLEILARRLEGEANDSAGCLNRTRRM
ncbi:MAG: peptide-methionine (S)-S-oxide reductase MsrA, partial [Novosphingobium sp.]|nr:peptide-methionine (S)-S-oxide reductase MsrA [Novosphingobium sp.]